MEFAEPSVPVVSACALDLCGTKACPVSTERSDYERELRVKEATIREVHHRVKNNLQTIESLLRMQMRRTDNSQVVDALLEAVTRINAMAVAHEMLSYAHGECVEVKSLALAVANQVKVGLVGASPNIRVVGRGRSGVIDAQGASSFALVVAEIVHNAIEHGLAERSEGVVSLSFVRDEHSLTTFIEDDGWGLPHGFSLGAGRSMGLVLMRTLVEEDLEGTITCGPGERGWGTRFIVTVPLADERGNSDKSNEENEGGAHEDCNS